MKNLKTDSTLLLIRNEASICRQKYDKTSNKYSKIRMLESIKLLIITAQRRKRRKYATQKVRK